jgi:hypothetical protein
MPKESAAKEKPEFQFCPQCEHKGLYHVHEHYYRCRYCGTYRIFNPVDTGNEPELTIITAKVEETAVIT